MQFEVRFFLEPLLALLELDHGAVALVGLGELRRLAAAVIQLAVDPAVRRTVTREHADGAGVRGQHAIELSTDEVALHPFDVELGPDSDHLTLLTIDGGGDHITNLLSNRLRLSRLLGNLNLGLLGPLQFLEGIDLCPELVVLEGRGLLDLHDLGLALTEGGVGELDLAL